MPSVPLGEPPRGPNRREASRSSRVACHVAAIRVTVTGAETRSHTAGPCPPPSDTAASREGSTWASKRGAPPPHRMAEQTRFPAETYAGDTRWPKVNKDGLNPSSFLPTCGPRPLGIGEPRTRPSQVLETHLQAMPLPPAPVPPPPTPAGTCPVPSSGRLGGGVDTASAPGSLTTWQERHDAGRCLQTRPVTGATARETSR